MKKIFIFISVCTVVLFVGVYIWSMRFLTNEINSAIISNAEKTKEANETILQDNEPRQIIIDFHNHFEVYREGKLENTFTTFKEALSYASSLEKASIKKKGDSKELWDNYPTYLVKKDKKLQEEFYLFHEAVKYAKKNNNSYIYYKKNDALIWTDTTKLANEFLIENAPHIMQMPELPRGCEVTSLAMLLNYRQKSVDKMTLAKEIKKDPTPYKEENGKIYFGNPNDGFVGDIYSFSKHGLGVYHKPVYALLKKYLPNSSLDLTNCEFEDLLYFINQKVPVWVIITTSYEQLPKNKFFKWITPTGEIQITYSEHSVLITGYDDNFIYFNDPLVPNKSKANRKKFIKAWEQMGKQAITLTP